MKQRKIHIGTGEAEGQQHRSKLEHLFKMERKLITSIGFVLSCSEKPNSFDLIQCTGHTIKQTDGLKLWGNIIEYVSNWLHSTKCLPVLVFKVTWAINFRFILESVSSAVYTVEDVLVDRCGAWKQMGTHWTNSFPKWGQCPLKALEILQIGHEGSFHPSMIYSMLP